MKEDEGSKVKNPSEASKQRRHQEKTSVRRRKAGREGKETWASAAPQ